MEKPQRITRLWHTPDDPPQVNTRGNARIVVIRKYSNGEMGVEQTFITKDELWDDFKFEVREMVAWAYTDALLLSAINEIKKKTNEVKQ